MRERGGCALRQQHARFNRRRRDQSDALCLRKRDGGRGNVQHLLELRHHLRIGQQSLPALRLRDDESELISSA